MPNDDVTRKPEAQEAGSSRSKNGTSTSNNANSPKVKSFTLSQFREQEGQDNRKRRLHALWKHVCMHGYGFHVEPGGKSPAKIDLPGFSQEKAEALQAAYENELMKYFGTSPSRHHIEWHEFKRYAESKESELWSIFHDQLDLDGDGHIDAKELDTALRDANIQLTPETIKEFMTFLTFTSDRQSITFAEFRDFLLLLPRKVSPAEIYQYYEMKRFLGDDGRGIAHVTMEGDLSLSAEDKPPAGTAQPLSHFDLPTIQDIQNDDELENDDYHRDELIDEFKTAFKFLLAGGIAGAVSRTCTAPFDRLKIFLITRPPDLEGMALMAKPVGGLKTLGSAIARIYLEGGVLAFWTGNGLSVAKIFPESAIKFFSYESSKRLFAKYWDHVEDPRDISGYSRFISGGIGGITSQLSIYPVETLKTQMMSTTGEQKRTLIEAARRVWALGGTRAYYRGLTIGLVGVFPYSAIDMSTFEALKLAYIRSTGKEDPGVLAMLAFGSLSGGVGATAVYPMNLVRTRLQASGSSGHPQRYTGSWDVCVKTWTNEGWRGFYRGLFPTLAKVVPAVSISYVVYEHSKRRLGVY